MTELLPVSEWVYDLYKVEYWVGEPEEGGRVIKTCHIASSNGNHLASDANENAPHDCTYMTWHVVKENVGPPSVIGRMHGVNIYEDGISLGRRLNG